MQQADATASKETAAPPSPGDGWRWSERLTRWVAPGASTATGHIPPAEHKFRAGEDNPSKAGILSADARRKIRESAKRLDSLTESWLNQAELGNMKALSMLLDRLEGPVEQQVRATIESRYTIEEVGVPYVDIPASAVSVPEQFRHSSGTESASAAPESQVGIAGNAIQAIAASSHAQAANQAELQSPTDAYVEQAQSLTPVASDNTPYDTLADADVRDREIDNPGADPDSGETLPHPKAPPKGPIDVPAPGTGE